MVVETGALPLFVQLLSSSNDEVKEQAVRRAELRRGSELFILRPSLADGKRKPAHSLTIDRRLAAHLLAVVTSSPKRVPKQRYRSPGARSFCGQF